MHGVPIEVEVDELTESVARTAVTIHDEFEGAEEAAARGELTAGEALAYEEGLLFALEVLGANLPADTRRRLQSHTSFSPTPEVCPACRGVRVQEIGSSGWTCIDCGRAAPPVY